jgi:hypothetical protein
MGPHPIVARRAGESPDGLLRKVRAGFVLRGLTFNRWCTENDVDRRYAERCLKGVRDGPEARLLRHRIRVAAGLETDDAAAA